MSQVMPTINLNGIERTSSSKMVMDVREPLAYPAPNGLPGNVGFFGPLGYGIGRVLYNPSRIGALAHKRCALSGFLLGT